MFPDAQTELIRRLPYAFAYHEIVTDSAGNAIDFLFLDVNQAFEEMTGLKKDRVLKRRVTEVLPGIRNLGFDWVKIYGDVMKSDKSISFRQYSAPLDRWYDVTAFSDAPGFFCTIFREVTQDVEQALMLRKMVEISQYLLQRVGDEIDDREIVETAKMISGAVCVAFNLYNDAGTAFTTTAISKMDAGISDIAEFLGFNPIGWEWAHDLSRERVMGSQEITEFKSLHHLTKGILPGELIQNVEDTYDLGAVYVSRISKDTIMLGDFTIFMSKDHALQNSEYLKLLAGLMGQYLDHQKTEEKLRVKQEEMESFFTINLDLLCIMDTGGRILRLNGAWNDIFGYAPEEMLGRKLVDFIHPQDIPFSAEMIKQLTTREKVQNFTNRCRTKDGAHRYMEWRASFKDDRIYAAARDITERIQIVKTLQESNDRFDELARQSRTVTWSVDSEGLYTYVNPVVREIFGYSPEELIGKVHFYDLFVVEERDEYKKKFFDVLSKHESFVHFINAVRTKEGGTTLVSTSGVPVFGEDGTLIGYNGSDTDVTEKVNMEKRSVLEREKFEAILLSVVDGIIATDSHGAISVMNQVAERLTGWTKEEALGRPVEEIFQTIRGDESVACAIAPFHDLMTEGTPELVNQTSLVTRAGTHIPIEHNAAPIRGIHGGVTGVVIVFRDDTERRKKQREIEHLSFHDYLTGLYNRRYFEDAVARLDTSRNLPMSITVIDINGLKLTNDAYGHDKGDLLLITVAEILKNSCRSDDIIARTGGDEFMLLHPNTDKNQVDNIHKRIYANVEKAKFESIILSVALGYAVKTDPDQSMREVIKLADNRMYRNKLKYGRLMRNQTIEIVLRSINEKHDKEQIHIERVSRYCEAIARALHFRESDIEEIKTVGMLHDIGKISVSPDVLNKRERLTKEEWEEVKRHPVTGYNLLKSIDDYAGLAEAVLYHHERWDGKGYPSGLKGMDIPLYSRIINIADAYEAMTTERSYQRIKTKEEAIAELRAHAGKQFDSNIVDVFIENVLK